MIEQEDYNLAAGLLQEGRKPSFILRVIAKRHSDISPPDLMDLAQQVFGATRNQVLCIGGWDEGGSGEISDGRLDEVLGERRISRQG